MLRGLPGNCAPRTQGWTPKVVRRHELTQNNVQLFGLLYYDKPLTNYRVRLEYQFQEPQAKNGAGWSNHNSGIMVFNSKLPA